MDFAELERRANEYERALARRVKRDGDYILLDGYYDVPVKELRDGAKACEWVMHLAEKGWVTAPMLGRMLELARGRKGT